MPGTRSRTEAESLLERLVDLAHTRAWNPRLAVANVAEAIANLEAERGAATLRGHQLRLFDGIDIQPCRALHEIVAGHQAPTPGLLGHLYERLLAPATRRRGGTHLTPARIARNIIDRLEPQWLDPWVADQSDPGARPAGAADGQRVILDPSVGGGAFLLAAADEMVEHGVPAIEVLMALHGRDIDTDALAIAEAALALWSLDHGLEPVPLPGLAHGDGLIDELPSANVVVGNPPFLTALRRASSGGPDRRAALARRWGDLISAYTDEAWLFLAAACDATQPGGQVALVQPLSVLAARHAAAVRAFLDGNATMTGLWMSDGKVFDASVEVCVPTLRRLPILTARETESSMPIRRWSGRSFTELAPFAAQAGPEQWGRVGAGAVGVPNVVLDRSTGTLADMATATAGFRDQFYGFVPHVAESADRSENPRDRLVTVGMIDPFELRWGTTEFRFAGNRYRYPAVDRLALEQADEDLARWVGARRRPKLLVATQTRILEAWADEIGDAIPATPVIAIEPRDPAHLFSLLAMVMAPSISADVASSVFGTALSPKAIKLSARDLLAIPLPSDRAAWQEGARAASHLQHAGGREDGAVLDVFAEAMWRAYQPASGRSRSGPTVKRWWYDRWPNR